jgi:putative cell wall-binding protein
MLMASVLAVVAGSPAQAANTSSEVLIDTDGDGVPDSREFAGRDRYDTALKLAHNFAGRSKYSAVPTVFLASGESLVDSISVAGLAGSLSAPVLLTPGNSLHGGVADYIEDHGVSTVYVLGGSAAISDATLKEIESLMHTPTATRIWGNDRYETAAKIAAEIQSAASWCGTSASSAVLINGATDALPFGVAVGTMAYALDVPVLMTAADELPAPTADYLRDNDIEHVQIIGGTDIVSAAVAGALSTLGVDTVQRVDGESAAEVSVELAKTAASCQTAGGATVGTVAADRVVLVRGNPDGVAAAAVLANGIAGDASTGLVPPLVVGDTLPAVVRDYLAATPKTVGGNKLNLGIVAVGGTAAVSESVMDAATEAAASTGDLAVQIGSTTDTNKDNATTADDPVRPQRYVPGTGADATSPTFTLYFSDIVSIGDADSSASQALQDANAKLVGMLRDIIEINGVPAVISAAAQGGVNCDSTKVDVTLGQPLKAGDKISVVESKHKFGTATDQRTVAPVSTTVQAAPVDTGRPAVSIVGIAGTGAFYVTITDPGGLAPLDASALDEDDFVFTPHADAKTGAIITTGAVTSSEVPTATPASLPTRMTAVVPITRTAVDNVVAANELMVGDRLALKEGVIKDLRKPRPNVNREVSTAAFKAQASPQIEAVLMSEPNHSEQNRWTVPEALVAGAASSGGTDHSITITAKKSGDAAGAAGNGWTFVFDRASTYSTQKPLDIDVRVDTGGKRVTVRFNNGPLTATLGDLLAALKANSDFDERFSAGFTTCANAAAGGRAQLGLVTTAAGRNQSSAGAATGRTKVAIEVHFKAYVDTVDHNELLEDVLENAALRAGKTNDTTALTGIRIDATGGTVAGDGTVTPGTAGGGLSLATPTSIATIVDALTTGTPPTEVVRYEAVTALVSNLPQLGDRVVTKAGIAAHDAVGDLPATTAVAAVATGYAADANASGTTVNTDARDTVDEDKNAASTVPISLGSRVKAPK